VESGPPLCLTNCSPTGPPPASFSSGDGIPGNWVYWFSSWYSTTASKYTPSEVWVSIQVPSSGTVNGDQYALVFNVFDSQYYFDQIGLASDYGCGACGNPTNTWSIAWEQGTWGTFDGVTGCGWGGQHSRDGYDNVGLSPLGWYTFAMKLGGDELTFDVYSGQNSLSDLIWSQTESDSAPYFLVQGLSPMCNGGPSGEGMGAVSLFEEVDNIASSTQDVPRWNFEFYQPTVYLSSKDIVLLPDSSFGTGSESCDTACPSVPQGYEWVETSTYVLTVANEAYGISFSADSYSVAPGGSLLVEGYLLPIGDASPSDFCATHSCTFTLSCTFPPSSSNECYADTPVPSSDIYNSLGYTFTLTTSASPGEYYEGINIDVTSTSPAQYTNFVFYIDVT
jgi:hypothetical protein